MHVYYAVVIAAVAGIALGAVVTGMMANTTPKAYIVTEVDVTGDMEVFLRDYAAHVQATVRSVRRQVSRARRQNHQRRG